MIDTLPFVGINDFTTYTSYCHTTTKHQQASIMFYNVFDNQGWKVLLETYPTPTQAIKARMIDLYLISSHKITLSSFNHSLSNLCAIEQIFNIAFPFLVDKASLEAILNDLKLVSFKVFLIVSLENLTSNTLQFSCFLYCNIDPT